MKRILLILGLIFVNGISYASPKGAWVAINSTPLVVSCSTTTATLLISDASGIELVGYDNQNTDDIVLATCTVTSAASNTYRLKGNSGLTWIPSTSFKYGLAISTSALDLQTIIIK
jgi:hypothetical protein